jgi:hypothetical protein
MTDCSEDVVAFQDEKVSLPQAERTAMRDRRDSNRKRVQDGLDADKKPKPLEFTTQGSYAMKTMVQDPDNNYDIDDGAYFEKSSLVGAKGAEMSPLDARDMVRDAVDDGSFKRKPETLKNCVRVFYEKGYHVDIPVYRRVVTPTIFGQDEVHYELASAEWKRSDARDVTTWFEKENDSKSPDKENGRQLRRMCRLLKKFATSRPSWCDSTASGFMITKLVTERYAPNANREDQALYDTMKGIRDRLELDLVVKHPVTPNDTITKGSDDPKAKFFRDRLSDALKWLEPAVNNSGKADALKCWDKVFNTDFFSGQAGDGGGGKGALGIGLIKSMGDASKKAVHKEGGGRYA